VSAGAVSAGAVLAGTVLAGALLAGCAAGVGSTHGPSESPSAAPSASSATASPGTAPSVVAGGISLRLLGFDHGPIDAFSVPAASVVVVRVDQPNAVTVVMSEPSPAEIAAYYQRALPAAGFTITADDPATHTLTFAGHGWTGAVTGEGDTTAAALRPA
jgi:hypothetical protein